MKLFKLVDVLFYFNDEGKKHLREYLCAIGEYDENDKECQEWDSEIFYWFQDHDELESAKEYDGHNEFTVISYKYRR